NGDGTFRAQQIIATDKYLSSVLLGDVNADSKPDLITCNPGDKTVGVLLGNGDGTFRAQQTFAAGRSPISVALGDVNGDGKPDLCTKNEGDNTVSVLLGNGDGTFDASQTFGSMFPRSDNDFHRLVVLGDVNGDGTPDLCTGSDA